MTEGARDRGRGGSGISARAATWLAWSVCAFSLVLTALGLVFLVLNRSHPGVPVFEFTFRATVITASCSSVGVVIASIIAALVVGALFDPVRHRIQRFVDGYLHPGGGRRPEHREETKPS